MALQNEFYRDHEQEVKLHGRGQPDLLGEPSDSSDCKGAGNRNRSNLLHNLKKNSVIQIPDNIRLNHQVPCRESVEASISIHPLHGSGI